MHYLRLKNSIHVFFMKNSILYVFLWFFCLTGCDSSKKDQEQLQNRRVDALSLIYDEDSMRSIKIGENVPFTGIAEWFHDNGVIQQETSYLDGLEHGSAIWWHEDGTRAGQCMYEMGVLNGPMVQWHPGGVAKEMQVQYQSGKMDGREIWWHENGFEESITTHVKGVMQGMAVGWFEDGSKSWQANWVDGKTQGQYVEWYSTGQVMGVANYVFGEKTGRETRWFEDGEKAMEVEWKTGVRHGNMIEYYDNGKKMSQTPYINGLRQGNGVGWHENEQKAFDVLYYAGEEVRVIEYDENGKRITPEFTVSTGRSRRWREGEVDFYRDKARDLVYKVFGEPDKSGENSWRYDEISVGGKRSQVLFVFENAKVKDVRVMGR